MAVDRMQWGAEEWQYADLYMPDQPSPFQKDEGVPCIMLIHGGFWKEQYTLDLMQPIAEDLAEAGIAAWNIEFKRWSPGDEGVWWTPYRTCCELGVNSPSFQALTSPAQWSWGIPQGVNSPC